MRAPVALVTGARGEMGHLLLPALQRRGWSVGAVDPPPPPGPLAASVEESRVASVTDTEAMTRVFSETRPEAVFHLAAMLSTKAEREPDLAHDVNVNATLSLFRLARGAAGALGRQVRFLFP